MTAFFMGCYEHSLDAKGRLIVPSKLRDQIDPAEDGDGFVATPGFEECLFLYTTNEWRRICQAQMAHPKGSEQLRKFQRILFADAEPLSPDKQGRVLLPERLRRQAGIDREIVLAGCYDRIEIWARGKWEVEQGIARRSYAEQAEQFLGSGTQAGEHEG